MKWILNTLYVLLLLVVSPVVFWRSLRHGRYRKGWQEKLFGLLPQNNDGQRVVWFHAVSVGEVVQLEKVVAEFRRRTQDRFQVVVTTSTDTGYELAVERFPECTVTWFPLDLSWAVSAALHRVNPELVVLFELELWPNFLNECAARSVNTALVNARMGERSYAGYSRIQSLIAPVFSGFAVVGAQSQEYADRLRNLGCQKDAIHVTGSVKFDGVLTDRANAKTESLRRLFKIAGGDVVLVAGSTQDPEELTAVEAWNQLRKTCPELRLIIVPRHRERFGTVAVAIVRSGHQVVRRSTLDAGADISADAVILLDTIGELGACWGLADIAFVGGSFGTRGGQNMLEPAAFGAAVLFGPNTWNFKEIVTQLKRHDAAVELASPGDLVSQAGQLIEDARRRQEIGTAARRLVQSQQGAIGQTVDMLCDIVDRHNAASIAA